MAGVLQRTLLSGAGHSLTQVLGSLALWRPQQQLCLLTTTSSSAEAAQSAASTLSSETPSTSTSKWSAAWPFVDPTRPQILPVQLSGSRPKPAALDDALKQIQATASPSHSIDISVRFKLDPRRSDHLVRGSVVLPYGRGKQVKVAVFAKGAEADLARELGADIVGDEEYITEIINTQGAAIRFDKLIATPDFMKPLSKAGKILGPKGLMPNPKMGTLTTDIERALRETRQGRLDYRLGKDAVVRAAVGKASMPTEHVLTNLGGLFHSLIESRPKSIAGEGLSDYVLSVVLRSSQSPGQRVSLASCEAAVPLFIKATGGAAAAQQQQQDKEQ